MYYILLTSDDVNMSDKNDSDFTVECTCAALVKWMNKSKFVGYKYRLWQLYVGKNKASSKLSIDGFSWLITFEQKYDKLTKPFLE